VKHTTNNNGNVLTCRTLGRVCGSEQRHVSLPGFAAGMAQEICVPVTAPAATSSDGSGHRQVSPFPPRLKNNNVGSTKLMKTRCIEFLWKLAEAFNYSPFAPAPVYTNAIPVPARKAGTRHGLSASALAITLLLISSLGSQAGLHIWKGGGPNNYWNNAANWSAGGIPSANETGPIEIMFPSNGTATAILDIPNLKVNRLTIYREDMKLGAVNGYKLTLVPEGTNYYGHNMVVRQFVDYCEIQSSLGLILTNRCAFDVRYEYQCPDWQCWGEMGHLRIASKIEGSGSLEVTVGTVELSGTNANTYTGMTKVDDNASIIANKTNAVSLPGHVYVDGRVYFWNSGQTTASNTFDVPGSLEVRHNVSALIGDLTVGEYTTLQATNGTIVFGGDVTMNGPADFIGTFSLGPVSGRSYHRRFILNSGVFFRGKIIGPAEATLLKEGPAMLFLLGTNTYQGPTLITEGKLMITTNSTLGTLGNGTTVVAPGELALWDGTTTAEPITVIGETNGPSLFPQVYPFYTDYTVFLPFEFGGHCVLNGPVNIHNYATFGSRDFLEEFGSSSITFSNVISGPGTIVVTNNLILGIAGPATNTVTGGLFISEGVARLVKPAGVTAISGPIEIGDGKSDVESVEELVLMAANQIADSSSIHIIHPGRFTANAFAETFSSLDMMGGRVEGSGNSITIAGPITTHATNVPAVISKPLTLGFGSGVVEVENGLASPDLHIADPISSGIFQSLSKYGAGELRLDGANSHGGWTHLLEGKMVLGHHLSLGASTLGMTASTNTVLEILFNNSLITEPLYLTDCIVRQNSGTNIFSAPFSLTGNVTFEPVNSTSLLVLSNSIGGNGGFSKEGAGALELSGAAENVFVGATFVNEGVVRLKKPAGVTAISGTPLSLGTSRPGSSGTMTVDLFASNQIQDNCAVQVHNTGLLRHNGWSEAVGSLAGSGDVVLGNGQLTVGNANTDSLFSGTMTGSGATSLVKVGSGTLLLSGNNALSGKTLLHGGKLVINGSLGAGSVMVNNGAMLGGTGLVAQIAGNGGMVNPGNSVGILKSGLITWTPSHTFRAEINGTTPGVNCDQLDVVGGINLAGATLNVSLGFAGGVSNQFLLIKNDGTDAITGTFAGLAEGATFVAGGAQFKITYKGGSGSNDVVLTQLTVSAPPSSSGITQLPNGHMQIGGEGIPGQLYAVQANINLNTTNWVLIGNSTADGAGHFSFVDTNAPNFAMRFYRFLIP
jgi:autotransporter-associated beta strand protein